MNGRSKKAGRGGMKAGIGMGLCLAGLAGCIAGPDSTEAGNGAGADDGTAAVAARMSGGGAQMRCARGGGHRHMHHHPWFKCPPAGLPDSGETRFLLQEEWDAFDPAVWAGDGDQSVENGAFTARSGAASAAADWSAAEDSLLAGGGRVVFANELVTDLSNPSDLRGRSALLYLSGDVDESYENYLIVDVRYFPRDGMVRIESYGAGGGTEFDRISELAWARAGEGRLGLEMAVTRESYVISVDGAVVDSIPLGGTLNGVSLFEVGVQKGPEGAMGRIDRTSIRLESPATGTPPGSHHGGYAHCKRRAAGSFEKRHRARLAREQMSHCARPSRALKASARFGR